MAITPSLQCALKHHQAGHLEEAEAGYRAILDGEPGDPHALHFLGVISLQKNDAETAATLLAQAVAALPDEPVFLCNQGQALMQLGQTDAARASLMRSVALAPGLVQAWNNLALLYESEGDDFQALTCRLRCSSLPGGRDAGPDLLRLLLRVGHHWFEAGDGRKAVECFRQATDIAPRDFAAWSGLASSQTLTGRPLQAMPAFDRALELAPDDPSLHNNRANALRDAGLLSESLAGYADALRLRPDYCDAQSNLLFASLAVPDCDAPRLAALCRAGAAMFAAPAVVRSSRQIGEKPRVAFVSADFRQHPVAWFMLAWFRNRDRSKFELTIYNVGHQADLTTSEIRAATDNWVECAALDDAALAERIARDRIDLLVDLSGHTAYNRLGVFARRPAYRQVTYLGYAGTTGLDCFDFRIADHITEPESESALSSEPLYRLVGSYFCYTPPNLDLQVAPSPCSRQRHVTFGSSAQLGKVTDATLTLWASALKAVPRSRLLVRSICLDDPLVRKKFLARASRAGIDPGRIRTEGGRPLVEHLRSWNGIDITLDTTPFNLATQSCESLWMGVPLVTLSGNRHAGRMGASILSAAGLGEWVAPDAEGFVARCVDLASDLERLKEMRLNMRARLFADGGLMDPISFASRLDAALAEASR